MTTSEQMRQLVEFGLEAVEDGKYRTMVQSEGFILITQPNREEMVGRD